MGAMFSWVNRVDTGSLTAGSQASTLPVTNLADKKVQKVWRALSNSTYFGVDFGSALSTRILGLFGCNIISTDTVRHRLSATALGNGELLDTGAVASGVQTGYAATLYLLAAAVNARYWRCDISAPSRASDFDIGRAWAGPVWAPVIGFAPGYRERWVDTSERIRSRRSGVNFNIDGAQYRQMSVSFEGLTSADRTEALELDRVAGKRGQVLFIPDTTGTLATSAILGRLTDTASLVEPDDSYPAAFSKDYEIEQDL